MQRFSYLVIGGGSGGIASARRAALHGATVALVSGCRREAVGGTARIIASFRFKARSPDGEHAEIPNAAGGTWGLGRHLRQRGLCSQEDHVQCGQSRDGLSFRERLRLQRGQRASI